MSFSAPGSPPPPQSPGPHDPYGAPAQPYAAQPYAAQPYPADPYAAQPYPGPPSFPPGPPHAGPPPAGGVLRSSRGLATALTVLLSVAAVVNLFSSANNLYVWSLMKDVITDPLAVSDDTLDQSDMITAATGIFQILALLGTAVVFIIWFHRVRVNGGIFRPDAFTQGPGWAIGGWFIPFANLVLPFRTAKQTWAASTQLGPDGSPRTTSTAPLTAWWTVWVVAALLDRVFAQMYKKAETPESLRDASVVGFFSDLTMVAAAVLAILFVRKLTALQDVKAVQGPYAAV
ncbi:DUF4328 domain-containing protein [Streptomyces sp. NPDC003042]